MNPALRPGRLGPLELRNRVIKTATFEGMTPGGRPSDALIAHHAAMAQGVALTTVAYGAVASEGRTFPDQLLLDEGSLPGLRRLTDAVHAAGAAASVQLTHCGGFSRHSPDGRAPGGPSHALNAYGVVHGLPCVRALSDEDVRGVIDAFARGAALAVRAGFDAVEVHVGHGYLLSQFLSPALNRRRDRWGRDAEGRARLAVEVVRAVREAVGPGVAVLAKLNTSDGVRGGLTVDGAVDAARRLVHAGVDALVPSGGLVQRTPFFLLRGRTPVREMAAAEHHPLQRWMLRLAAPVVLRAHPYAPTFFLDDAARILAAVRVPVVLLGGVDSSAAVRRALDRGFDFVAVGRALLADPDFVARLEDDAFVSRCTHCNVCVAEMERGGVRCVL